LFIKKFKIINMKKILLPFVLGLIVIFSACKKSGNQNVNQNSGFTNDTMIYYKQPVSSLNTALGTLFYADKGVQFNFFGNTDANGNISKVTAVTLNKLYNFDTVYNYVLDSNSNVAYYYISVNGINDSIVLSYTYQDTTETINGYVVNWNTEQAKLKEQTIISNATYMVKSDVAYKISKATGLSFVQNAVFAVVGTAGTLLLVGAAITSTPVLGVAVAIDATLSAYMGLNAGGAAITQAQESDWYNNIKNGISNIKNINLNINLVSSAEASEDVPTTFGPNPKSQIGNILFPTNVSANFPVVTTNLVTAITNNSAVSGGNAINDGGSTITMKGVCWSSVNSSPTLQNNEGFTSDGPGKGEFTSDVSFLLASKSYHLRAYAINANGTSYGNDQPFTTASSLYATITTNTVTSVTANSATCGGDITNQGGSPVTARGVYYATHSNPTILDNTVPAGSGTGSFTCSISGLSPGVQYYAKAFAINSTGTSYGNEQPFTTSMAVNPLNNTNWVGYYNCPTWGPLPANDIPGYITPANTLPITIQILVTNDTSVSASSYFPISGSTESWLGSCNVTGTLITWKSAGLYVTPVNWTISGSTMTGLLTNSAGCANMAFTLQKQ
jgi:hypothetical protein